ncbi:MAG: FIST N-terminal domain-containing protein [Synechococcales bacterium]|nr:FIST N-terminal domain-containing protein [Synechococcales bacterium]
MTTLAGVGISHHRHTTRASQEAVQQALTAAQITGTPDFVFLFASLGYDQTQLLQAVRAATGHCPLAGCSGQGIIVQQEADESGFSVAVLAIQSDELTLQNHFVTDLQQNSYQAGTTLGSKITCDIRTHNCEDAVALLLFPDGFTFNFDRFKSGLETELDLQHPLPILGGAAGSDTEMRHTYQYYNDQVLQNGAVAVLLSGQAQIVWGLHHGCSPIGTERKVTKAIANRIYELDGKPIFQVLQEYLTLEEIKTWDRTIGTFCFGLRSPLLPEGELTIRYLPGRNEAEGYVTLQSEVPEGTSIWVMRRAAEKLSEGIDQVATEIQNQIGRDRQPKLIFQFDCYGRGSTILTQQQKLDLVEQLQSNFDRQLPWIGFYTHGELAPINSENALHNYTVVLTAIY